MEFGGKIRDQVSPLSVYPASLPLRTLIFYHMENVMSRKRLNKL
jgi:hypothetical protein